MDGVTIVNIMAEEVHKGSFLGPGTIFGILAIMLGLAFFISAVKTDVFTAVPAVGFMLIGLIVIGLTYKDYGPVIDYDYTYEVIVDDDVNFKEFCNRYEVLERRGNIYTVKEREN